MSEDKDLKDLRSRFIAEGRSGLTERQLAKLGSFQLDIRKFTKEQLAAFKKECEWQDTMKDFRKDEVNVRHAKSKTKVYLRCYWINRRMQDRVVKEYDNKIDAQIREIKNQFTKADLDDPDIQEFIADCIRTIKGR